MGSRLLNGSPQLSVRVTLLPLILIVFSSTLTLGTILGTPVTKKFNKLYTYSVYVILCIYQYSGNLLQEEIFMNQTVLANSQKKYL